MNQGLTSKEYDELRDLIVKCNMLQSAHLSAIFKKQYERQKRYEDERPTDKRFLSKHTDSIK